jgi:hypothetical protein
MNRISDVKLKKWREEALFFKSRPSFWSEEIGKSMMMITLEFADVILTLTQELADLAVLRKISEKEFVADNQLKNRGSHDHNSREL